MKKVIVVCFSLFFMNNIYAHEVTVPVSHVGPGTFSAGVLLPSSQLTGAINPTTQIGAGMLNDKVTISSSQVVGFNVADSIITAHNDPITSIEGDVYYNLREDTLYIYDGSTWNGLNSSEAEIDELRKDNIKLRRRLRRLEEAVFN